MPEDDRCLLSFDFNKEPFDWGASIEEWKKASWIKANPSYVERTPEYLERMKLLFTDGVVFPSTKEARKKWTTLP